MIKVITKDQVVEPKPFPKWMKHTDGTITFFLSEGRGIHFFWPSDNASSYINELVSNIEMNRYSDHNEPITIQNV